MKKTLHQKLREQSFIRSTRKHDVRRVIPLSVVFKLLKEEKKEDKKIIKKCQKIMENLWEEIEGEIK